MKEQLLSLTSGQEEAILESLSDFRGLGTTLESALGALIVGQRMGWRVLKLLHNPATYKKYEKILGIEFKEVCPETTERSKKSVGYVITQKIGAFWDIVMGRKKVSNKGEIANEKDANAMADMEVKKIEQR